MAWQYLEWGTEASGFRRVADQIAYRTLSYRDLAKKLGHGTNYYGLPPTMAKHTKVDRPLIEDFQKNYFQAFPAIGSFDKHDHTTPHWHNRVRHQLRDVGSITTLLGRRRGFFGRWNDDETLRAAIAYEPQSLTADEINTGIHALFRAKKVDLLIQVHDSILTQIPEDQENELVPWALETLKTPIDLKQGRRFTVPTEAKVGWNWADANDENPDGLIKWKGGDLRSRWELPRSLSVDDL
jgi:DNA polymerase I-like protein with 3'-5' exonuclease and polymerase domains